MAYLSREELLRRGFKHVGADVRISDRAIIYEPENFSIGDRSRIDDLCILSGRITIGCNVHVAVFCTVAGGEPGVTLDDFSGLAYGCHIFAQSDDYSGASLTNPTVPREFKKEIKSPVVIGRHAIIGAQSVVFPGVDLAEGTSVGAMSLVNRSTEAWSIYAGIPARKVATRSKALLEVEQRYQESMGVKGASRIRPAPVKD